MTNARENGVYAYDEAQATIERCDIRGGTEGRA